MSTLINALDVLYGIVGLLFAAGAGALMLMFAFVQITARLAIWLDVGKAYAERKQLAFEVVQLKSALDTLAGTSDDQESPIDYDKPMVKIVDLTGPPGGQSTVQS